MTKRVAGFLILMLMVMSNAVFAGGIVTKQTLSADYLRTFSRNSAIDGADAAYYNPAGTVKLQDGFIVDFTGIYTGKEYSNTIGGQRSVSDTPSPGSAFYGLYKKNQWAGFVGINVPGGGGKVDFDNGSATTYAIGTGIIAAHPGFDTLESMRLSANSYYYAYFTGVAYAMNPQLSIAGGIRYVDATKEAEGTVVLSGTAPSTPFTVCYEQSASGTGGFLGVNWSPAAVLNIGLRYETAVKLDFETDLKKDDTNGAAGLNDGAKTREDLPGLVGLGILYRIRPDFAAVWSTTLYLEKAANWEGRLADQGNSWESALALEYDITPKIKASCGYMVTRLHMDTDAMLPEAPELDVKTFCGGVRFVAAKGLTMNFGVAKSIYSPRKNSAGVGLDKTAPALGMGVSYAF